MAKKYENVEKITSLLDDEKLGGVQKRLLSTEKSLSGILKKLASLETEKQEREAAEAVAKAEAELGDTGRILVRESGTEPLIRVMAEAENEEICRKYVDSVVDIIKAKGYAV